MFQIHKHGFWWRSNRTTNGFSISFPSKRPLFSERYGYHRPILKLFGFRVFRLETLIKKVALIRSLVITEDDVRLRDEHGMWWKADADTLVREHFDHPEFVTITYLKNAPSKLTAQSRTK